MAFIALVPLALVCRRAGPGRAAAAGMVFGLVFFGLLFPWIHLFGMAAYVLLVALEAAFVAVSLALGTLMRRRLSPRLGFLAFPMAFLVGEYVRSHLPLGGFPWGGLGYSQHNNLLVLRLASYTGVWGVSLLVATVNALLAEALLTAPGAPAGAGLRVALAAALLLGPALLPVTTPRGASATLALVQGNAPTKDLLHPRVSQLQAVHDEASVTARLHGRKVALVVWPESSVGRNPFKHPALLGPLEASIQAVQAPFLVGANIGVAAVPGIDDGAPRFRNESLLFNAAGALQSRYVKIHLVPFGEYVPARRLLTGWIKELNRVPVDGIPGTTASVFTIRQGTFASAICYETAYPELVGAFVRNGARMLIISTDNSSYLRTPASAQMVAISQVRAAEQRMWVSQAALTGISAVIAPSGRVVERAGLFRPALLTPTVRFATGETVYGRYGDWLPIAVMASCAFLLAVSLLPAGVRTAPEPPEAERSDAPATSGAGTPA